MTKRIYIAVIIALFGAAALFVSGNWVVLILIVLAQIVTLLIGNVSDDELDKAVLKSIPGGGIPRPKDPPKDDEPSDDLGG